MALTEEQKSRMEENRRKAMDRQKLKAATTTPAPTDAATKTAAATSAVAAASFYSKPATTSTPPAPKSHPNSFPTTSASSPRRVTGKAELVSPSRFAVTTPFHDGAVAAFKTLPSAKYDARDRVWSFDVADHAHLVKRVAALRPDFVLDPLPEWVVRTFGSLGAGERERRRRSLGPAEWETVEPSLREGLMPFQKEGVEFALKRQGRVLIADDMGLGKTVQALAIASAYRQKWPLVVVCPSSVRFTWKEAIVRWIPSLPEEDIAVLTSSKDAWNVGNGAIILSYDLLPKKEKEFAEVGFRVAILDESHFVKNKKSNRAMAADKVFKKTEHLVLLSGTPALSRPMELFSQVHMLRPRLFQYATPFGMRYCDGRQMVFNGANIYDFKGSSHMGELKILLEETCMIRRLKSEVLAQLPSKRRQMIILDPSMVSTKTKDMKEKAREIQKKSLSNEERRSVLLQWFNLTSGSKKKAVLDYLKDLLEGETKFICFAHHKEMLDAIDELLEKKRVRFVRIDGGTKSSVRNSLVQQFQCDEQTRVALLSIAACYSGLTLTSAQTVVFAELYWNPGILTQAEDRAHRIGQTDCVRIQYLVAKGTADDEIWPLLQKKLDVLNKGGLSKDNFQDSDASEAAASKKPSDGSQGSPSGGGKRKISDYFSSSLLEGVNMEERGEDEEFWAEEEKEGVEPSPEKVSRMDH